MVRRVLRAEEVERVGLKTGGMSGFLAQKPGQKTFNGGSKGASKDHNNDSDVSNLRRSNRSSYNRTIVQSVSKPTNKQSSGKTRYPASGNNRQSRRDVENAASNNQQFDGTYGSFELRRHQIEAIEFLGKSGLRSRLIGDEMRVGKTPTALGIDFELRKQVDRKQRGNDCTLIVCPKSVIGVWVHHLILMGVDKKRIVEIDLPAKSSLRKILSKIAAEKRKSSATARYVIINWNAVSGLEKELKSAGPWFHIIGDEIHWIKGRTSKRTKSFKKLPTKFKTGLSGTPADNKPEDFWSVLHWCYPATFGGFWQFVDDYCTYFTTRSGFKKITGVNAKALPELRAKMASFYVRRKLADVADSLPQKQYRTIEVVMGARQRREYDEFVEKDIVDIEGGDIIGDYEIVRLTRLQQLAIGTCSVDSDGNVHITDSPASPKLDALMELIIDEPEAGPYIVFGQHRDTVRLVEERLRKAAISSASITGPKDKAERWDECQRFQSSKADVFVGTIATCREGIDLSRGNTIVFVDRAWNPNWNKQAEARADSLTSTKPVSVIYLQTKGSIDEHRRLRIESKGRDTEAISSLT